jgi:hypothetical protein
LKLSDFELKEGNHFIAMQYYGLILNRTFLVLITEEYLIALKVNGIVSVEVNHGNPITRKITNSLAITDDLENPYSYAKNSFLNRLAEKDIYGEDIIEDCSCNFKIPKSDITEVYYDKKKKWGMGPYPHDGKVYIKTRNKNIEFIILGNQSGKKVKNWIEN